MQPIPTAELIPFALLTLALAALWLRPEEPARALREWAWALLVGAAALSALLSGVLAWTGLGCLGVLAIASWALHRPALGGTARAAAAVAVLVLSAGLLLHVVPGFANPRIVSEAVLKADALPYTKYLNFDKGTLGLLLVAFGWRTVSSRAGWRRVVLETGPVLAVTLAGVLITALSIGYFRFDPAPPATSIALVWAWTNLFFTCIAEEAVFRGVIQRGLESGAERFLPGRRWGRAAALFLAAVVFGLAHAAGGWGYAGLSVVAGLGYGYAMQRTGRLEAAVLTHFGVNAVHIALFTYPALAG